MIRQIINYATFALWTAVLFPLTLLAMLLTLDAGTSIWIARRVWAPVLLRIAGARLHFHGQEHVAPDRPTIYVANHQSTIDIPILFVALPVNLRFVAKSQLKWVPILGWYLVLARHVLIDRANSRRAIQSLEDAGRKIRSGVSIIMFAEGTRSEDGRVLPFKKGPFLLALKAGVAVVPVTIEGSGAMMPKNSWAVRKNRDVHVKLGAPIDASRYRVEDRDQLIRDVRAVIIEQSLQLGGKGGDRDDAIAASGYEGVGRGRSQAAAS